MVLTGPTKLKGSNHQTTNLVFPNFLFIGPKHFFLSLQLEKGINKYSLKTFVDSEIEIGETI